MIDVPLPVADRWFDVAGVGGGVVAITEPHLDVLLRSNAWFVRGRDRDLLVDTANGIGRLRPVIEGLQGESGREVVAVATHHHTDHIGGLHEFDVRVAHPLDADAIARGLDEAVLTRSGFDDEFRAAVEIDGYVMPEVLVTALPFAGFDVEVFSVEPTEPTRLMEEGQVIDLGDPVFEVLHLPGHTPGGIGLWDADAGVLFSGDTVYRDDVLLDEMPGSSIPDYVASMQRLRELPVTVVHGGHDPSFGRERLIERCDEYLARRAGG